MCSLQYPVVRVHTLLQEDMQSLDVRYQPVQMCADLDFGLAAYMLANAR